jgi:formylglycine-generating enzyme required for sulfatase activity
MDKAEGNNDNEDMLSIDMSKGRVLHGGSFTLLASHVRCATRLRYVPATRFSLVGFRPARTFAP